MLVWDITNSCFSQRDNSLEEEQGVFSDLGRDCCYFPALLSSEHHPVDGGKWSITDVGPGCTVLGQPEPHFWDLPCVLGLIWHISVVLCAL